MEKGQFSNEVKVRRGEFEKRYQKRKLWEGYNAFNWVKSAD